MQNSNHGKQNLIDYLSKNPAAISREEALKFLTHPHRPNRYRALDTMVDNGQLIRFFHAKRAYYKLGALTPIKVPPQDRPTITNREEQWKTIAKALIKFTVQQRMNPARLRYNDIVRALVEAWKPTIEWIQFCDEYLNSDISHSVAMDLLDQAGMDPDRDIYQTLDRIIEALSDTGAQLDNPILGFSDDQLNSIAWWDDARPLTDINESIDEAPQDSLETT